MPKYLLSSAFGGIITGMILIVFGRQLYPEISTSYAMFWVLFAGTLTGLVAGLTGHFVQHPVQLLISITAIGVFLFFIFSVILAATILYSVLLGGAIGLMTGYIILFFGSNSWTQIKENQE